MDTANQHAVDRAAFYVRVKASLDTSFLDWRRAVRTFDQVIKGSGVIPWEHHNDNDRPTACWVVEGRPETLARLRANLAALVRDYAARLSGVVMVPLGDLEEIAAAKNGAHEACLPGVADDRALVQVGEQA